MFDNNDISPAIMQQLRRQAESDGVTLDDLLMHMLTMQTETHWLTQVIQALPTVVIMIDEDGKITFTNGRIIEVFGYTPAEVITKPLEILLMQEHQQSHKEHRKHFLKTPETRPMGKGLKLKGRHKTGRSIPVEVGLSYFKTEKDLQGIAIVTDLSEQEKAKREFTAKETRAKAVLEAIPDIVIRVNPEGVFLDYHRAKDDEFEFDDIPVAPDLYSIFPDEVVNLLNPHIEITLASNNLQKVEYQLPFPEGVISYYEARIVKSGNDEVTIIIRDVTEQKQIEAELRRTSERMQDIIEAGHIGLWQWDLGTANTYYSPEWKKQLGYEDHEFPNDHNAFEATLHPDDLPGIRRAIEVTIAEARQNERVEYRARHKDGSYHWIVSQGSIVSDDAGNPVQLIGTTVDITEQKEAQQYEFDLALEKERLNILQEFIQGAAHEFRTPLSIINTCMYLIERIEDPDAKEDKKHQITLQVERLSRLVDMLLLVVKLESGNILSCTDLKLDEIIRSIVDYRQHSHQQDAKLVAELEPDLPTIYADEEYIREIFGQLLDNAYHATREGDTITISAYYKNQRVHVDIQDTGIGIKQADIPHIFQTFWRDDKMHTTPGFGLGLPIVRKIVEQHGGNIHVTSKPDEGTTIKLSLPTKKLTF